MTMTFRVHNFRPYPSLAEDVDKLMLLIANSVQTTTKKTFYFIGEAHNSDLDVLRRKNLFERIARETPSVVVVIERGMGLEPRFDDIVERTDPSKVSSGDDLRNHLIAKAILRNVKSANAVVVFLFGSEHDAPIRAALTSRTSEEDDEVCNWVSVPPNARRPDAPLVEIKMTTTTVSRDPDAYTTSFGNPTLAENLLKLSQGMPIPVFTMRVYAPEMIKGLVMPGNAVFAVYVNEVSKRNSLVRNMNEKGGDCAVEVTATGLQDFVLRRVLYKDLP